MKQKRSIIRRFNDLFAIIVYLVIWTILAVIGQFCELWDVEYWVGIYVFLLPILISGCSLLSMLGADGKLIVMKFIILPIFCGASYIGLQYATYGIRALTPGNYFYANWIYPWLGFCVAIWSFAFVFVGWIINKLMNKFEDND